MKKAISTLLVASMCAATLAGCGEMQIHPQTQTTAAQKTQ